MKGSDIRVRGPFLVCLFLVLITVLAYHGATQLDFVNYDDDQYVARNDHIQKGFSAESLRWAFAERETAYWHPVTWLSHILDIELFGLRPGGHHLTNLLLHVASAIVLFFSLYRFSGALWQSACVSLLFAVHPLNVESVAWISERKSVLSTFFWMLSLLVYSAYVQKPSWGRYALLFISMAIGLMAKPMLVTLPCALLLLDFWPAGRVQLRPARQQKETIPRSIVVFFTTNRALILEKIPLFVLSAASVGVSIISIRLNSGIVSTEAVPVMRRLANAAVSYVTYIGKLFWPTDLAVLYPFPEQLSIWAVFAGVVLVVGISAFAVYRIRSWPYFFVGWFWYIGTLVPVIGIVQAGVWPAVADRFMYIPMIGIFIILAWGADDLTRKLRHRKLWLAGVTGGVLILLTVSTMHQVQYWRDGATLFKHTLRVTGGNWVVFYTYAHGLHAKGDITGAMENYRKALAANPNYYATHHGLGLAFAMKGDAESAIFHFHETLRLRPDHDGAHYNLGKVYLNQNDIGSATRHFRRALEIEPDMLIALYNLSWILATTTEDTVRDGSEAVRLATRLCELTEYRQPLALDALAAGYAETGQFDNALSIARKAHQLAVQHGLTELSAGLLERLELYRSNQPYRQIR